MIKKDELDQTLFLEELKMIQDIINRMANNSFLIKGWSITLIVGILTFSGNQSHFIYEVVFVPLFLFWILDAFFLQKEKLLRKHFEWVVKNRKSTDEYLFDFKVNRFKEIKFLDTMFSMSILSFHGLTFLTLIAIIYIK